MDIKAEPLGPDVVQAQLKLPTRPNICFWLARHTKTAPRLYCTPPQNASIKVQSMCALLSLPFEAGFLFDPSLSAAGYEFALCPSCQVPHFNKLHHTDKGFKIFQNQMTLWRNPFNVGGSGLCRVWPAVKMINHFRNTELSIWNVFFYFRVESFVAWQYSDIREETFFKYLK